MASPCDPTEDIYNHEVFGNPGEEMNWDDEEIPEHQNVPRCSNHYFTAEYLPIPNGPHTSSHHSDRDVRRCCRVMIDKRMTLAKLKKCLEQYVGVPMEYFKIYRQYANQDVEWTTLNDTLGTSKDGERLIVKLGRVLKRNEYLGKIYHLTPENTDTFSLLFEFIIAKGETVGSVKRDILFQAKKQHMLDIPFHKCRLRKKSCNNPTKVYLDDQKFFDDISISANFHIFLQELPDGEQSTSTLQLVLFVRRWCPSTLTLMPFHEVVLDYTTMDELKKKISEKSGIPQDCVEVLHVKDTFPCDMNVLDIHNNPDWNPNVIHLDKCPLQIFDDGSVFIYR